MQGGQRKNLDRDAVVQEEVFSAVQRSSAQISTALTTVGRGGLFLNQTSYAQLNVDHA